MILVCPLCRTKYLVPATVFAAGARQVRCARCSHSWQAALPQEIEVVAEPVAAPAIIYPEAAAQPLPAGSNLPALIRPQLGLWIKIPAALGAAFIVIAFLWLALHRDDVISGWPGMTGFYDAIGLHKEYAGEGLVIDEVHSELIDDGGLKKLVVDGKINNKTQKSQLVPDIIAAAIGPDGDVMQSWQIDAPAARLAPAAAVPFRSTINAPRGTVVTINLNFIEPKNDSN